MKTVKEGQYKIPVQFMEWLEKWGYITAGVSFLLLGMIIFFYGWYVFVQNFADGILVAGLELMKDLLLVIILLELFRTVLNYLRTQTFTLEPFLYVGIVAAIRKILTTGAMETISGDTSQEHFNRYVLDLGLHGVLVVLLVTAMFIYKKFLARD